MEQIHRQRKLEQSVIETLGWSIDRVSRTCPEDLIRALKTKHVPPNNTPTITPIVYTKPKDIFKHVLLPQKHKSYVSNISKNEDLMKTYTTLVRLIEVKSRAIEDVQLLYTLEDRNRLKKGLQLDIQAYKDCIHAIQVKVAELRTVQKKQDAMLSLLTTMDSKNTHDTTHREQLTASINESRQYTHLLENILSTNKDKTPQYYTST